jgi:hypothetical protein
LQIYEISVQKEMFHLMVAPVIYIPSWSTDRSR